MKSKLNYIEDWVKLARTSNWSASMLAKECGVSVRSLHRFFLRTMGKNTKAFLAELSQIYAQELLNVGSSIKETALCLGYRHPTSFSRKYKVHWGINPRRKTVSVRK
jgi:AraC-like DNA-binding protein